MRGRGLGLCIVFFTSQGSCKSVFTTTTSHPELELLGQQVVVLVTLVQSHQNVLQPVSHAKGELAQLGVQAGLDV